MGMFPQECMIFNFGFQKSDKCLFKTCQTLQIVNHEFKIHEHPFFNHIDEIHPSLCHCLFASIINILKNNQKVPWTISLK